MSILGGVVGAFSALVDSVGRVIDDVTTTEEEKLRANLELQRAISGVQVKMAELELEAVKAQASVIQAELKSESWLARSWRPILMLTFNYIIAHQFILVPWLDIPSVAIPDQMWSLVEVGIGGYIISRGVEKGIERAAPAATQIATTMFPNGVRGLPAKK